MSSLPPPVWAELFYNGAFNSITADLHARAPVSVTRGRSGERDSAGPSQGAMTLLNTNAKFSRRNPNSALYGQIGLNTPIRYGYDGVGSVWAESTGAVTSYLSTPSSASYNITSDLDVRVEVASESWTSDNSNIANRYDATTNARGWSLRVSASGVPQLFWSTDGTTSPSVSATAYLPAHAGQRIALRATLDVSNAAGVYEVRFYTGLDAGSSDEDDWHLLGDPVIGATSTSVNNPSLPVRFGALPTSAFPGLEGRLYRLQLRNGIGGPVLLDVDTSLATVGAGSFQDAAGHTWTANSVTFTRRHVRFHGEVPDWTPLRDKSGNFKTVSISPAGISRRLSSGEKVLRSPLFREMSNRARQNIVAYWPLEDSSDALSLASGLAGGRTGSFSGDVSLAADSTSWLSSDPLPTIRAGKVTLPVLSYTDTGEMSLRFLLAVPSTGVTANGVMARLTTTGTVRVWELGIRTDGSLRVTAYDSDGAQLADNIISFTVNGTTSAITFEVSVSGSTITRRLLVTPYTPGLTIQDAITPGSSTGTLTGTAVGRVTSLQLGDGTADLGGITVGHPAIANSLNGYANTGNATLGWNGEPARNRLLRLAAEEEVPLSVAMADPALPQMGVQQSSTFLDLIRQVETVDQGLLFERRDGTELAYRAASTLINQQPVLTLDFGNGLFDDIRPKDDDRAAFNVMTAKRISGSEYTYELTEGANSTQDPPDGIGYYATSVDLSLASDDDLPDQAAWRVHVATVDEMRYPTITLNLANERVYALFDDIMRVDVGDKIRLTNLPPDYSVDDVDLLVWGPSEAPGPDSWPVTFTCVPAEPWNVGVAGSTTYGRADTDGSQTTAALSASATSVGVLTTGENRWVWTAGFPAEFPFDVRAGGEVWRVTACTPSVYDTFTRTVANGWATATSGQTWTSTGGAVGDHYTQGSEGVHKITAVNTALRDLITTPGADHDVRLSVSTDQAATGGDQYVAAVARATDETNLYMAQLQFSTSGAVTLTLRKRVASVESILGTWSGGVGASHTAFGKFYIRLQVKGSTLRCRAWSASTPEPGMWQIIATDTSLTTGTAVGARSVRTSSNTNANLLANYDDFELLNPQTFTVTRGINGVSKSHAAGTDVRLARPIYLAPKES
ncbi:hypothetical protein OIE43_18795 [Streptomyces pseudovenezuelae]|uniref:hypothetical protein n=1 Tax=Streptomyces pseudovenezuelae TaxID=67350 RepID=UPI002E300412|nr:hypothetical protein [Streptomyces pseudovenezuelae]